MPDLVRLKNGQLLSFENQSAVMQTKAKPHKALREGERMLNANQLNRIEKEVVSCLEGDVNKARELGLNVLEQIRFGSLAKKSYRTNKLISIEHAVNTACMLLRENRWSCENR